MHSIWFQLCFQNLSLTIFQEFGIGKIMLEHQNLLFGLYPFTFWFLWYLPLCWQSMSKNQFGRNWKSGSWKSRHCTTWISGCKITLNVLSEYDFYVSLVMELFNYQSLIFSTAVITSESKNYMVNFDAPLWRHQEDWE